MYQKIMVPLDGSKFAEGVFPHFEAFLKNGSVKKAVLVRVLEPLPFLYYCEIGTAFRDVRYDEVPSRLASLDEWQAQERRRALQYLEEIAARFSKYGAEIECQVLAGGQVAETLASYAQDNDFDLILTATHGLSGVGHRLWGSVANQVMRFSHMPVLMVGTTASA